MSERTPQRKPKAGAFLGAAHQALLRTFVGREPALKLLDAALAEATSRSEPRMVSCLGPGGMGKTTLLQVFGERARSAGHRVAWIDAGATPHDAASLEDALGMPLSALGTQAKADLLVLDGLERDPSFLAFFLDRSLAVIGARVLVVTTSRESLVLGPRASALSAITRELRLRPLSDEETLEGLARRGVPDKQRAELAALAAGLPRAIAELAERTRVDRPTPLAERPPHELVDAVAAGIVRDLPSTLHRRAVEAMAVALALDEPLLGAMLHGIAPPEEIRGLYDWLSALTFVVRDVRGLIPHPRVRDALHRELEVRDPVLRRELGKRAGSELVERVTDAGLATRHHHVIEALFAQRDVLTSGSASLLEGARQERVRRATEQDFGRALELVGSMDSELSPLLAALHRVHPERLLVLARPSAEPSLFVALFVLDDPSLSSPLPSPLPSEILRAARLAARGGPCVAFRCWSPNQKSDLTPAHLAAQVALSMVAVEELGASIAVGTMPAGFEGHAAIFGASRAPDHAYLTDLGALSEGATGAAGLDRLARNLGDRGRRSESARGARSVDPTPLRVELDLEAPMVEGDRPTSGVASIDEAVLSGWVRTALAARHRPHELKKSPLLELTSVLALAKAHGLTPEQALARFLDESCRALAGSPAYESSARLLELTYLDPTIVKQEAAAAELRLPFGTYRYQLRRALELVTLEIAARDEQARKA